MGYGQDNRLILPDHVRNVIGSEPWRQINSPYGRSAKAKTQWVSYNLIPASRVVLIKGMGQIFINGEVIGNDFLELLTELLDEYPSSSCRAPLEPMFGKQGIYSALGFFAGDEGDSALLNIFDSLGNLGVPGCFYRSLILRQRHLILELKITKQRLNLAWLKASDFLFDAFKSSCHDLILG